MEEAYVEPERLEKPRSEAQSYSPSFNSISSHHRFAETADINSTGSDDDGTEFSFVRTGAEEDQQQHQISYPIFNRDLLPIELTRRLSLRKLFDNEDGDNPLWLSPSSSHAAPNESVPAGAYSAWRPKRVEGQPASRSKKSNWAGGLGWNTSNFRDSLLCRSNSAGKKKEKENSLFCVTTPKNNSEQKGNNMQRKLLNDYNKPTGLNPRRSLDTLMVTDENGKGGRGPPLLFSSRADELESVPAGTYSVWRPKEVENSRCRCKKKNEAGSSAKQWKVCDFFVGQGCRQGKKESSVFLSPKKREHGKILERVEILKK